MPFIGPTDRTYIRKRETPIFPSRSKLYPTDGYTIHPCKNGFGAYLTYVPLLNRNTGGMRSRPVISGAYGEILHTRIEVEKEASYSVWDAGEEVFACLAFFKGRIYYGATFGEGMIIDFDGSDYIEYAEERRFQNRRWSDEATLERAWKYAERCAERMAEKRAEEIEEDQAEQDAAREEEEKEEARLREVARNMAKTVPVPANVSVHGNARVKLLGDGSALVFAEYPIFIELP